MEVSKINSANPIFLLPKKKDIPSKNEPSNGSVTNVALAGLAAIGVIGAAILAIKSHKPSSLNLEAFKEAGNKFVKGNAVTKNGKPFSGVIEKINKKGDKYSMQYVNGVLQEVKHSIKTFNGEFLPLGTKTYQYNEAGKLVSVEKSHLVMDMGIVTKKTNLDQKRKEGMEKFVKKQEENVLKAAEELKQKGIQEHVENTRKALSQKPEVNSQVIDKNLGGNKSELNKLNDYYKGLEEKETKIKESVSSLKENMHQKPEVNSQVIDKNLGGDKSELKKMKEHYTGLQAESLKIQGDKDLIKEKLYAKLTEQEKQNADFLKIVDEVIEKSKINGPLNKEIYAHESIADGLIVRARMKNQGIDPMNLGVFGNPKSFDPASGTMVLENGQSMNLRQMAEDMLSPDLSAFVDDMERLKQQSAPILERPKVALVQTAGGGVQEMVQMPDGKLMTEGQFHFPNTSPTFPRMEWD